MSARSIAEIEAADRRLEILRILQATPRYTAGHTVVAMALPFRGHVVSLDQMRTDFAWLREQGLLTIDEIATIQIATLTQRGVETALGIVVTPGVARPLPEA